MTDKFDNFEDLPDSPDEPVDELRDLRVEPNPDLQGRVRRDINRRTLTADSLDFSFNVMLHTFWEYLAGMVEIFPGRTPDHTDRP